MHGWAPARVMPRSKKPKPAGGSDSEADGPSAGAHRARGAAEEIVKVPCKPTNHSKNTGGSDNKTRKSKSKKGVQKRRMFDVSEFCDDVQFVHGFWVIVDNKSDSETDDDVENFD